MFYFQSSFDMSNWDRTLIKYKALLKAVDELTHANFTIEMITNIQ